MEPCSSLGEDVILKQGAKYNYEIIRQNLKTLTPSRSVLVVMGDVAAEIAVEQYDRNLSDRDREAGWSYFSQRTTKPVTSKAVRHPSSDQRGGRRK